MIFLDAGFLIGLIDSNDDLHSRAVAWLHFIQDRLVTTDYVLLEVSSYFSGTPLRIRSHEILDPMANRSDFELTHVDLRLREEGLTLHRQRPDKDWSLTDCVSFVVMQQRGILQALAHDHHFEQAGFEALLRRGPS